MKRKNVLPLLVFFIIAFSACRLSPKIPQQVSIRGVVFGTYYSISYFDKKATLYQEEIDSLFAVFNESMSYYVPQSLISRVNNNEAREVDEFFRVVYQHSLEVYQATEGAFDPTVSPLVNAWGFGFRKREDISQTMIDSLRQLTGLDHTRLEGNLIIKDDPRIQFDFNAIAKGYAADVVGKFLESKGISTYLVEIGGDLVVRGKKPDGSLWRIGLEKPATEAEDPQDYDYYVELLDQAVATSGNYRRYYEEGGQRFSHTIDPFTGYPVTHNLLSVSVFSPHGITSDAYATAFMVMGFEKAKAFVESHPEMDAFFIYSAGPEHFGTYATPGLKLLKRDKL
ncbi:MAG: FAD:protein FMN transferase [Bacteroidales bacterium]|jgi:thiamine biosynthesis lipoprotein|nr:FAD:protein FMN transferase [Bacteroidales bacterium]